MSKLSGGITPGELMVFTAGRQTGKSNLMQYMNNWKDMFTAEPAFESIASALVDGEPWHTVRCTKEVSAWVRTMNGKDWYEHIDQRGYISRNVFDMSERVYLMLAMKFS